MEHAVLVAEGDAAQELVHEGLDGEGVELATFAAGVHVFFEIAVHELEDEHEFVLSVDDIVERHNVFVLEFLHKGYLTNGR